MILLLVSSDPGFSRKERDVDRRKEEKKVGG